MELGTTFSQPVDPRWGQFEAFRDLERVLSLVQLEDKWLDSP